jgi:hypothetical protein
LPNLSMIIPQPNPPIISPIPRGIIENIVYFVFSFVFHPI